MKASRYVGLAAATMMLLAPAIARAQGADARLERVAVLRAAERLSIVLELTAEPQKVVTRELPGAVVDVEVGPVMGPVEAQELKPPSGVPFVSGVSVREGTGAGGTVLVHARIALLGRVRSNVRIVGRRVYIDFAAPAPPRQTARPPVAAAERPRPVAVSVSGKHGSAGSDSAAAREALEAARARFEAIEPFLLSAVASPSPEVLTALAGTLIELETQVRAIDAAAQDAAQHASLVSALAMARTSVQANFAGDRAARARDAYALWKAAALTAATGRSSS